MDSLDLRTLTRLTVLSLDSPTNDRRGRSLDELVEDLRTALAARGLKPGCHVGEKTWHEEKQIEWYAGQIIAVVDDEAWYAMNALINNLDKFCPAASNEAQA